MKNLLIFFIIFKINFGISQLTIAIVDIDNNPINDVAVIDASNKLVSISNPIGVVIVENENFPIILSKYNYETLKLENHQKQCVLIPKTKEISVISVKPHDKMKLLEEYLKKSIEYSSQTSDTAIGYYFAKRIDVNSSKDSNVIAQYCNMMLVKTKQNNYEIFVSNAKQSITKNNNQQLNCLNFTTFFDLKSIINNNNQTSLIKLNLNKKLYNKNDLSISGNNETQFLCSSKKIKAKNYKFLRFKDSLLIESKFEMDDSISKQNFIELKNYLKIGYSKNSLIINYLLFENHTFYSKMIFNPNLKQISIKRIGGFIENATLEKINMVKVDDLQEFFKSVPFDNNFSFNYQFE